MAGEGPLLPANPPPLKLSRLTIESRRLAIMDVEPLGGGELATVPETLCSFPPPIVPGGGADFEFDEGNDVPDRKSTRLNSSHSGESRMPSSA